MRNAVIALVLFMIVLYSGVIILTVETKTTRQNELDTNLGAAMEQSLVLLTTDSDPAYKIESKEELIADFIQNFLIKTTSDSKFTIDIITADFEKGFLDVKVTEAFGTYGGIRKVSARRTILLEDYVNNEDVYYTATFEVPTDMKNPDDDTKQNIVKKVNVHGGDTLTAALPTEPYVKDYTFKGWECVTPDIAITGQVFTDLSSINILGDYIFRAVFVETVTIAYSETEKTSEDVTITLEFLSEPKESELTAQGWTKVDALKYTKVYSANGEETVIYTDSKDNTCRILIYVDNIEKTAA